jgi:bifunctional non-homologous end joining protein LigD
MDEANAAGTTPNVVITNPSKVLWPAEQYTKRDLVDFYLAVAPWLLPYLRDRPLVLTRYPDGIDGKNFFQKNAPPHVPRWLRTQVLWNEEEHRDIEYFVCDDEAALMYVANMASIPLHVRAARLSNPQHPDWCILDLDPKGAPFTDVVAIAQHIHALCEEIGMPNYCKTSGSTGLHVLLPMGGSLTHAQSKQFAEVMARVVATELPEIATVERVIPKRRGKVYVDFIQNGHGRLLVSPLCVRPLPGAPVSTPLRWDEVVPSLDHRAFTIRTVPDRLAQVGDPMAPLLQARPDLPSILARLLPRL